MRSPSKHTRFGISDRTKPVPIDDVYWIPAGSWCVHTGGKTLGDQPVKTVYDAVNDNLPRLYQSVTWSKATESPQFAELREEMAVLRSRLDKIDAILAREQAIDDEIVKEMEAIGEEPVNELDIAPADWLPTRKEIKELLDD